MLAQQVDQRPADERIVIDDQDLRHPSPFARSTGGFGHFDPPAQRVKGYTVGPTRVGTVMDEDEPVAAALPLLSEAYRRRLTGTLLLGREDDRLRLAIRDGQIVGLHDDGRPEAVPPPDDSVRMRLHRVLEDLGLQTASARSAAPRVSADVRGRLLAALGAAPSEARFEDGDPESGPAHALSGSTEQLILEAVRSSLDPEAVRSGLGNLDRLLVATAALAEERTLTLTEGHLLSQIDGSTTAREVLQLLSSQDSDDVERSLLGLLLTGRLEYRTPARRPGPRRPAAPTPPPPVTLPPPAPTVEALEVQPPAPPPPARQELSEEILAQRREVIERFQALPGQNHFEVLGVQPGCSDADVKQAYVALVRRYHPDVRRDRGLNDLRDVLEGIFIRIGEAWEVLGDPRSRAAYELRFPRPFPREAAAPGAPVPPSGPVGPVEPEVAREGEPLLPDEALYQAHVLQLQGKYWEAIQVLEGAIPSWQQRAQQHRGRLVLARLLSKNPNWLRKAEETLKEVVREDPANVDAHFELGLVYKAAKQPHRAQAMFRRVVELRPDHAGATAELGREGTTGSALFKRFFKPKS
jgi:hypothetical protein